MKTKIYKIKGMNCASCATLLEIDLEDVGISSKCSYVEEILEIEGEHDVQKVSDLVAKSGYTLIK
ncbi:MAG TPA: hypothetical protein VL401_01795 [Alphaproteobacteria bacterium]|jgi:copper chaperone CopZ|nr:hypothetical protein [Alphaproteobacteria bacterium]